MAAPEQISATAQRNLDAVQRGKDAMSAADRAALRAFVFDRMHPDAAAEALDA